MPPPPVIVKAQVPAACGVTVKEPPAPDEIVAIPLQEFACPDAGVELVKVPL